MAHQILAAVLLGIPLLCAAYVAVATTQLVTFFGAFMLVGALAANATGNIAAGLLIAFTGSSLGGLAAGWSLQKLRGLEFAVVGICLAEISRVLFVGSDVSQHGLGLQLAVPSGLILQETSLIEKSAAAAFAVAVLWIVERSALRDKVRLAAHDEVAARLLGVDVVQLRYVSLALIGGLCGLAGFEHLRNFALLGTSALGYQAGVLALAPALMFGSRGFWRTLLFGCALIAVDQTLQAAQQWRAFYYGVVILIGTVGMLRADQHVASGGR